MGFPRICLRDFETLKHFYFVLQVAGWVLLGASEHVVAQSEEDTALYNQLERIFKDEEFSADTFGPARWLGDGTYFTTVEPSESIDEATDIVRYETVSGKREILVSAKQRMPLGATKPLEIDDYEWSADEDKLLLFTNSKRVWRQNTRGDYWVLDLQSGNLRKLGGVATSSSLMFAKFSPDGSRVGYVFGNNLYVENILTGVVKPLTRDGSATTINGTSDWVYEEEFGLRDAFRWSPDGKHIAFWNFDTRGVGEFTIINNTKDLYPTLTRIGYPKAGTINSAVRIGVVNTTSGVLSWVNVPGDSRDTYIPRMEWAGVDQIVLQHLNRLQNMNDVLLGDIETGSVTSFYQDKNEAWVEYVREMEWIPNSDELLWLSEKEGFRKAYAVSRSGGGADRLLTRFASDIIQPIRVDKKGEWFYFLASPDSAVERYLYRASISENVPPQRLTPDSLVGTHEYDVAPDGTWAFHTYSRFDQPPRVDLVELPKHTVIRSLVTNESLQKKLQEELAPPVEMFQVEIEGSVKLDAWMLKPRDFDSTKTYPLLVYVYGEPAGQTVLDRWFGSRTMFHRALAKRGFLVVSFDNRGTPAPKGTDWRKIVYGTVGDLSSRDQAAAVKALVKERRYIDLDRVAIWGWSGGGSNTLNAMFRFPDIFRVGVSVAPVPDQKLYDTIYQERYMGLPQENEAGYRLGSPINFAEGLKGKLLLIHGTADDNVHYQGAELLVNRLIELGKSFDFMSYPNRSHSIREGAGTTLHLHKLIARYFLETEWVH